MPLTWRSGVEASMGLFSSRCTSCGALIELPGRIGFRSKGGGDVSMLCRRCRQVAWLSRRDGRPGRWTQRSIPLVAIGLGVLLAAAGVRLHRSGGLWGQGSFPAAESLSR